MPRPLLRPTVWILLGSLISPALGQEPPSGGPAGSTPVDELLTNLPQIPASELAIRLAPLTAAELERLSEAALVRLRAVADRLSSALIDQNRLYARPDAGEEERSAIDQGVAALVEEKAELLSRTETILEAWRAKGGAVESARAYVAVIRGLEPAIATADEPESPAEQLSPEEQAQAALSATVNEVISRVREDPPVHERPAPWTVPLRELELELQPLRVAQMDERVQKWLEILQREIRRRIRIDIAMARAEDADQRTELAVRSAEQQEIVKAVVTRLRTALLVLQKRGGDVTEYGHYIATATGQKLNLTDPAVLYAQAIAWLKSRDGGIRLGLDILKFVAILFAFYILSRIIAKAVGTAVNRLQKVSTLLRAFLVGSARRLTLLIGLVIAIGALGVNITPVVAAIGAAGLVIGLALQGTLSNFASGILILIYRPYDIGDVIEGGGVSGKVESMSLVSTSILTFDNRVMIVPNNQVWNGVITNATGRNTRRVDLVFGIGYGDDIGKAIEVLQAELRGHEKVLEDPAPNVKVHELGDSSVNLIARPWVRTQDYWEVYWDLMHRVKERFDEAGLNIPYPQRDLHVPGPIEVRLAREDSR